MTDDGVPMVENRTFAEIQVGDQASLQRTIAREDIQLYAAVGGDANPTHLDEAFARQARFKGIVAHSMLTAGLISNLLGNRLPGLTTPWRGGGAELQPPAIAGLFGLSWRTRR